MFNQLQNHQKPIKHLKCKESTSYHQLANQCFRLLRTRNHQGASQEHQPIQQPRPSTQLDQTQLARSLPKSTLPSTSTPSRAPSTRLPTAPSPNRKSKQEPSQRSAPSRSVPSRSLSRTSSASTTSQQTDAWLSPRKPASASRGWTRLS